MDYLKNIIRLKYFLFILLIWGIFASPFLLFGKTPYPSDYQVNFFQPWTQYEGMAGPVKNNAQPDIIGQIYPWRYFAIEELKHGSIPFWNPFSFSGTPHLANYQSAVLSFYNIFFFFPVKFITAWGILVVLQPLLAGLFAYIFSRTLKISEKGSLQTAVAFMFCGFIVTWMGYATLAYAILPLPLSLFAIEKYVASQKHRYAAIMSLCIPLSFFSGHFQTSLYFLLGLSMYLLFGSLFQKEKRRYLYLFQYVFFGILLCAPQVLPSIEFYTQSVRSGLFQKFEAIPWAYLPTLIAPDYYGNPVTRNDWFGHYAEWNGYAGAITLLFAINSAFVIRNKHVIFFVILLFLSLLLAYDTPLLTLLVNLKVPVLSTSAASRIIVLFSFSVAMLSGFGFDAINKLIVKKNKKVFLPLCILIGCILIVSVVPFIGLMSQDKALIAKKNMILPVGFSLVAITLLVLGYVMNKKRIYTALIIGVLLISIFEMLRFSSKWQSFNDPKLVYVSVPITKFYNSLNHYDRAIGLSGGEDSVYYRVPIPRGYDPLYIGRYGEFVGYVSSGKLQFPERSVVNFPLSSDLTPRAISLLGVKTIVHKISDGTFPWAFPFDKYPLPQFTKVYEDSSYRAYKNNNAQNKAFTVNNVMVMQDKKKMLDALFSVDTKNNAFVEEEIEQLDLNAKTTTKIKKYEPNRIEINVNSSGKSFLVLTDNYYPGWKATINGRVSKIFRTDYSFRGVVVPKGDSTIVFSYMPESFIIGTYLFMVGILGIIIIEVIRAFKK